MVPKDLHSFDKSLAIGKRGEKYVSDKYGTVATIKHVALETEKSHGIDALWSNIADIGGYKVPMSYSVEVKTDEKWQKYGNCFFEIAIIERDGRTTPGWVGKTCANFILYLLAPQMHELWIDTVKLKRRIRRQWKDDYPIRESNNVGGWKGKGVCVPVDVVKATVCSRVVYNTTDKASVYY